MRSPAEIIRVLQMSPHPEGGWYVEIHRSPVQVHAVGDSRPDRSAMTSIYYLLEAGQRSHWHRVDADELWAWHAGSPMELSVAHPHGDAPDRRGQGDAWLLTHRLGADLASGERPQAVVPAHAWQSAQPLGAWSLVGCVVAPGFEFSRFEIAPAGWHPGR